MSANSHHVLKRDYLEYRQSQRAISEAQLENALIYYLCNDLKYQYNRAIKTQRDLKTNFKAKLELLNKVELPEREFEKIWIQLNQGDTLDLFKQITYNQPQVEINHRTRVLAYFVLVQSKITTLKSSTNYGWLMMLALVTALMYW